MSVHEHGGGYRVRWYQSGRQHSKTFARKPDADLYNLEIKRAKALSPHIMRELQRGTQTFEEFIRGDWTDHAASFAPKTRAKYRWVLENHAGDLLSEPLAMIDGQRLARHQRQLLARGLRPNTVREILTALGAILQVAVDYGHIPHNPARSLRKVRRDPRKPIVALEPVELDQLIARSAGRDRAAAVLGGWLGLRPIEIRSIPWCRLHGDRLAIEQADTKPQARPRTIDVPAAAAQALREWRLEAGRPADHEPIIGHDTRRMNYWNVRLRQLAGRDDLRINSLRDTHASMLHYAGYTIPEAAARMGHTPHVHLEHYARVLDTLTGRRYADLDALIAASRDREGTPYAQHLPAG
jgi:hypothetical protein